MQTRIVHAIAGTIILISLLSGIYIDPNWFWLTAFVGVNMWIHALTDRCLMYWILDKLGIRNTKADCSK
ncbi:DUF2892 domain-containing protein [Epilithonimonas sp.]|uniref:YgaP family membrane protein n=1 Tax=Epilithonimonas sp. TaxID=2894511 RepID=UPI0035B386F8